MYECDCCGQKNVPEKLKGIGYVCENCLAAYCWTGYESGPAPEPHYPVCPFKRQVQDTEPDGPVVTRAMLLYGTPRALEQFRGRPDDRV